MMSHPSRIGSPACLALVLLAPFTARAEDAKCIQVFRRLAAVGEVREEIEFVLGTNAMASGSPLERRFVERCRGLPAEAVSCGAKIRDLKTAYGCEGLSRILPQSVQDLVPLAQRRQTILLQADAEAEALLKAIAIYVEGTAGYQAVPPDFTLPASTPLTPRKPCCSRADGVCPVDGNDWTHPTWQRLKFRPSQPFRFQYRFTSEGKGDTVRFVVEAVGDPLCTGERETWRITGRVRAGRLQRDTWEALRVDPGR